MGRVIYCFPFPRAGVGITGHHAVKSTRKRRMTNSPAGLQSIGEGSGSNTLNTGISARGVVTTRSACHPNSLCPETLPENLRVTVLWPPVATLRTMMTLDGLLWNLTHVLCSEPDTYYQ